MASEGCNPTCPSAPGRRGGFAVQVQRANSPLQASSQPTPPLRIGQYSGATDEALDVEPFGYQFVELVIGQGFEVAHVRMLRLIEQEVGPQPPDLLVVSLV